MKEDEVMEIVRDTRKLPMCDHEGNGFVIVDGELFLVAERDAHQVRLDGRHAVPSFEPIERAGAMAAIAAAARSARMVPLSDAAITRLRNEPFAPEVTAALARRARSTMTDQIIWDGHEIDLRPHSPTRVKVVVRTPRAVCERDVDAGTGDLLLAALDNVADLAWNGATDAASRLLDYVMEVCRGREAAWHDAADSVLSGAWSSVGNELRSLPDRVARLRWVTAMQVASVRGAAGLGGHLLRFTPAWTTSTAKGYVAPGGVAVVSTPGPVHLVVLGQHVGGSDDWTVLNATRRELACILQMLDDGASEQLRRLTNAPSIEATYALYHQARYGPTTH